MKCSLPIPVFSLSMIRNIFNNRVNFVNSLFGLSFLSADKLRYGFSYFEYWCHVDRRKYRSVGIFVTPNHRNKINCNDRYSVYVINSRYDPCVSESCVGGT